MKHAYLIIAHNKFTQLQLLINLLDDNRNDIYVHIDKKSELPKLIAPKFSKLIIIDKRIDVRWGDISQVKVELLLLKTAYDNYKYEYFHLMSGIDLPIKSNDYIHNFFDKYQGLEFVGYVEPIDEVKYYYRCNRYHLFTRHYKTSNIVGKIFWSALRHVSECIFNIFPSRFPSDLEIKCGSNWISITNSFCNYLISQKDYILKIFKFSTCPDEMFVQTILWNSDFRYKIFKGNTEEYPYEHSIRLIDMSGGGGGGTPYIWGSSSLRWDYDINLLMKTKCIFARKFDLENFPDIIYIIMQKL